MLSNKKTSYKRHTERYATARDVQVAIAGGSETFPAVLMDVSPTGFKATLQPEITIGTEVELRIRDSQGLRATVLWQRDDLVGCEFVETISRHAVLALARAGMFGTTASPSA
jgi:hypothetical protein